MSKSIRISVILLSTLCVACSSNKKQDSATIGETEKITINAEQKEKIKVKIKLTNLERDLLNIRTREDVANFLKKNNDIASTYMELPNAHKEALFVEQLYQMYSHPAFKEFCNSVINYYGDYSDVKAQLEEAFTYIKYYYPDYKVPEIKTIVTGFKFNKDFYFSDSLIIISIDYFMGNRSKYRPDLFQYMLKRYDKPYLVPMIVTAISTKFNLSNTEDNTMLSEMIYYGKAHYFLERVLPNLPDSLNIQYSDKELREAHKYSHVIWGHFIEKKLFYETNHMEKQRYTGESPKVYVIGDNCPGRIGRWLGWQIVRKYMLENPHVTLQQLMQNKNAEEIFKKSKYKPSGKS